MPYAAGSSANRKEGPGVATAEVPDWQSVTRHAKWSASCFEPSHRSPAAPRETIATARHSSTHRGDMRTLKVVSFCALLAAVLATSASAQQAQTRQGFWIGGGMGYGSMGISCSGCPS